MPLAESGQSRRPFRPTPSPDLFVPHEAASAAADRVRAAYDAGDGIALVDGPPGTGKTLLALRFLESLPETAVRVYVPSSRLHTAAELYQAILFDLGKPYSGLSEHELRLSMTDHLLADLTAGRRGVLVLDEAHLLADSVLEEIRLLDNLDARGGKAVFSLLVGQPVLRQRLAAPGFEPLAQRIGCRPQLGALVPNDAERYLCAQLELCGERPDRVFTDEAIDMMVEVGAGVPRVLNRLAALARATAGRDVADAEAVYEAAERLGLLPAESELSAESSDSPPDGPEKPGGPGDLSPAREPKQKARKRRAA